MHEELLPIIQEMDRAVTARDARAAAAILGRLKDKTIYSGNEVYERLHAVEEDLIVVLFEGLGATEFGRVASEDNHLHYVWESLEKVAERVDAKDLWRIKSYLGFPSPHRCPKLHGTLAAAQDEAISEELIETIDSLATSEADEGASLSAHERSMSTFRFVRWSPDDKGLSDCVRLLAARSDRRARAACRHYLMELPWGADRPATVALLEGLSAHEDLADQNKRWLEEALAVHSGPVVLRTWLWGAIGDSDPGESVLGLIRDLGQVGDDADRITLIETLGSAFAKSTSPDPRVDSRAIGDAAEAVDTSAWSPVMRGYYGTLLASELPEADSDRVSTRLDRAGIAVARAWEEVRLDHMGCFAAPGPHARYGVAGWFRAGQAHGRACARLVAAPGAVLELDRLGPRHSANPLLGARDGPIQGAQWNRVLFLSPGCSDGRGCGPRRLIEVQAGTSQPRHSRQSHDPTTNSPVDDLSRCHGGVQRDGRGRPEYVCPHDRTAPSIPVRHFARCRARSGERQHVERDRQS